MLVAGLCAILKGRLTWVPRALRIATNQLKVIVVCLRLEDRETQTRGLSIEVCEELVAKGEEHLCRRVETR